MKDCNPISYSELKEILPTLDLQGEWVYVPLDDDVGFLASVENFDEMLRSGVKSYFNLTEESLEYAIESGGFGVIPIEAL